MNKINVKKTDGTRVNADLICYFKDNSNNMYVYYTLNEIAKGNTDTVKIYVSKIKQNNPASDMPIAPAEWDALKSYMAAVLKNEGIDNITYLPAPSDVETVGDMAIAMPLTYDYVNKHAKAYEDAITGKNNEISSTENPVPAAEPEPAPAEPTKAPEPTVEPTPVAPEVAPTPEPTPVAPTPEVTPEPVQEQTQEPEPVQAEVNNQTTNTNASAINIEEETKKLDEIIKMAEDLKQKVIEAANNYNSTLELNNMQINQRKEEIAKDMGTTAKANPEPAAINSAPVSNPTPITPVTPDASPVQAQAQASLETNWFDMPQNK